MTLPVALALALLATLGAAVPAAQAQPIYRCGNEYTRVPCPGARALEVSDPRSAAQRAEARRIAAEEEKRAHELERDRRRNEAAIKPAAATSMSLPPAATASAPPKSGTKDKKSSGSGKPGKARPGGATQQADFIAVPPLQAKASAPKGASAVAK